jgi:hypothetical protein
MDEIHCRTMDAKTADKLVDKDFDKLYEASLKLSRRIGGQMSDEHLAAIGQIVVSFQSLEFELAAGIGSILGVNQKVQDVLTSELSYKKLVSVFGVMYRLHVGESSEINLLTRKLFAVEEVRNQLIHSTWGGGWNAEAAVTRFKVSARNGKGHQVSIESYSVKDLTAITKWIRKITQVASGLIHRDVFLPLVQQSASK